MIIFLIDSDLLSYIVCLLIPAHLSYKSLDKKYPQNFKTNLFNYWIIYGVLSFPLDKVLDLLMNNETMKNLVKILFFSSLYHPKSNKIKYFTRLLELIFAKNQVYFKAYMEGFLSGFDSKTCSK